MLKLNSKISKLIITLLIIGMVISIASVVFAAPRNPTEYKGKETTAFDGIINQVIGIVQTIGSGVAVIIIIVLGVKYMLGSAEDKSEYKSSMLPYVVGAILIFAGVNIAGMVFNATQSIK